MFSLHETTRRRICRWGFTLLCLLPTCAVLGGAYWLRSDDYRRRHEAALAARFGLPVTLGGVTHPTPTTTRYQRVELFDPETKGLLARAEVALADERGQLLSLQLTQAEISSVFAERLRRWTDERLRGGAPGATRKVRLEPCSLVVNYFTPELTQKRLVEFSGQIDLGSEQSIAKLTCRLEGAAAAEPLTMRMWRDRSAKPARSGFELSTGGAVPCSMFAPLLPAITRLGNRAQFDGALWAVTTLGGWDGALEGPATITQIDLDALVSDQLPHRLSGTGQIALKAARFSRGRLQQAQGSLSAGPGFIGNTLLVAAAAEGLAVAVAPTKKPALSFDELAIDFVIDARGVSLEGQCHGVPAGTLLTMRYPDRELPVRVAVAPAERVGVAALVRALSAGSDALVPASAEAQSLARLLPIEPPGDRTARNKW